MSVHLSTTAAGATTPGFASQVTFGTGTRPVSVALGDFNGDGRPDLFVANEYQDSVSVFRNTTTAGAIAPSFAAHSLVPTGAKPYSAVVSDFNGDGRPDLAVANAQDDTVSVLMNTSAVGAAVPSFTPHTPFPAGDSPRSVAAADLNGDGRPDLAVANWRDDSLSVLLNTTAAGATTPTFTSQVTFVTGDRPYTVAAGDFNGDGRPDLVANNRMDSTVSVFLNTTSAGATTPTLSPPSTFTSGATPSAVAVGDVNADSRPDLVVSNESNTVSVLVNTTAVGAATPSWLAQEPLLAERVPYALVVADFTGDGRPDVAVVNRDSSTLSVFLNATTTTTATPALSPQDTFATGTKPYGVAVGDVNGDGRPDLVVADGGTNGTPGTTMSVLLNLTGAGGTTSAFTARSTFLTGSRPVAVALADLNADSRPDAIVADRQDNTVSVLLNTTAAGAAVPIFANRETFATGASPQSVAVGDFNGDGSPDLAVVNNGVAANSVSVLANFTGAGSTAPFFANQVSFAVGTGPRSVTVGDFNGDGRQDLAVTNKSDGSVSVLLNTTVTGVLTPAFAIHTPFPTGGGGYSVAAGDFNGDGRPDLAVGNQNNSVAVLLNTTTAGATTPSFVLGVFPSGNYATSVAVADMTSDGKPDVAVISQTGDQVFMLENRTPAGGAAPSFAAAVGFAVGDFPLAVAAGNVNGDGQPDLVVTNYGSNTASVLLNRTTRFVVFGNPTFGTIQDDDAPTSVTLAITANQSATVNTAFATALAVDVTNAAGAGVVNLPVTFTVFGSGPGASFPGGLVSTTVTTDGLGRATAPALTANTLAGGPYTVVASTSGLAATFSLTNVPGAAASLTPTSGVGQSTTVGTGFGQSLVVTARDAFGNPVSGVTVTFTAPAGSSFGGGAAGTTDGNGQVVKTFTANTVAGTFAVTAGAVGVVTPATFANLTNLSDVATHLDFLQQPGAGTAGAHLMPAVTVRVLDQFDNLTSGTVTLTANGPGAFTGASTTTVAAVNGVAAFSPLTLNTAGNYTLTATGSGVPALNSTAFTISPAAASRLAIGQQPTTGTAGVTLGPDLVVQVLDAFDNLTTSTATVTVLPIGPGPFTGSSNNSQPAAAGAATFTNLRLDTAGSYNFNVSAPFLAGAVSAVVTVGAAAPATITAGAGSSQSTGVGAAFGTSLVAMVTDAFGNPVGGISVTFDAPTAGASATFAGGTSATTNFSGQVSKAFTANTVAGSYAVTVRAAGVATPATFTALTNLPAAAHHLAFLQPPTDGTAGSPLVPAVAVRVFDQFDNPTSGTISVSATATDLGALPGPSTTLASSGGVSTFSNLVLTRATSYTLTATAAGVPALTSSAFTISPAAANHLAFTTQPANSLAGAALAPALAVELRDPFGNKTTTSGTTVLVTANGPGPLSGAPTSAGSVAGAADFAGLRLTTAGSYSISASAPGLLGTVTGSCTISAAPAAAVTAMAGSIQATTVGAAFGSGLVATVTDAFGNPVNGATVTFAVVSDNGAAATFSGGLTGATGPSGQVSKALTANTVAGSFTVTATVAGVTSPATFTGLTNRPGPATQLVFGQQPTDVTAGAALNPPVRVRVLDSFGNPTAGTVTVASVGSGGFTSSSVTTVVAADGEATFNSLTLNTAGASYTLTATAASLSATSSAFAVRPAAPHHLAFTQQPTAATAGVALSPALRVELRDPFDNLASGALNVLVTANGPGPLSGGATSVSAGSGSATFAGLKLNAAGSYSISASAPGLLGTVTDSFTVSAAPAATIIATAGAAQTTAVNSAFGANLLATVTDAFGNPVSGVPVTFAAPAAGAGATFGSATSNTDTSGQVRTSLTANTVAGNFAVTATANGVVTPATFGGFTSLPRAANKLVFRQPPTGTTAGVPLSPITVRVLDAFDNSTSGTVTLATSPAGGFTGGSTTTAVAVNGLATFGNLTLTAAGSYTVAATVGTLTVISALFTISPAAAQNLVITQQPPATATAGAALAPALTIRLRDAFNNFVLAGGTSVLVTANGPGQLGGTTTVTTNASGTATFNNLRLTVAGAYSISASAPGLLGTVSAGFTVSPAVPATVTASAGSSQAATVNSAFATRLMATVRDAFGNLTPNVTVTFTIAAGATGASGTFAEATTVVSDTNGTATAPVLTANGAAGAFSVTATAAGGGNPAVSFALTSLPGPADHLVFLQQPSGATAGLPIAPAVTVRVLDAFNNLTAGTVTLTANAPGGFTGGSTTAAAAVNGVATFSALTVLQAGSGYTLTAQATTLPTVTSNTFAVFPAAPHHLTFTQQPTGATAGAALGPVLTVQLRDAYENPVTASNISVLVTANGPGLLSGGPTAVTSSNGVATFPGLTLTTSGGYTIGASAPGLLGAASSSFTVNPAVADHLAFRQQPVGGTAGAALAPAVSVEVLDRFNNRVVSTAGVTVAAVGPAALAAGSTPTVAAANGLATFGNLKLNAAGSYTLTASAGGLTGASSSSFAVTAAPASRLAFVQQPLNAVAGAALAPAVTVEVLDAFGNRTGTPATVMVSATGPGPFAPGTTASAAASGGLATFSTLRLNAAGSYTLSAASTSLAGATSVSFSVLPAAASRLTLTAPAAVTVGVPFALVVRALDPFGNAATGFAGTPVRLTSTDPFAVLPADYSFTAADQGVHTFPVTLLSAGARTLTAADALGGAVTGSATVTVNAPTPVPTKRTWSGGAGPNDPHWSNPRNWQEFLVPAAGNDLVFPSDALTFAPDNDLKAGTVYRSLTFTGGRGGYTLTGNAVGLSAGLSDQTGAANTISLGALNLSAAQAFNAGSATLVVTSAINLGAFTLTLTGATVGGQGAGTALAGVVSGSGGLVKAGSNTWALGGANTYTGPTAVNAGNLLVTSSAALGSAAAGTAVAEAASLQVRGSPTPTQPFVLTEPLTLSGQGNGSSPGALNILDVNNTDVLNNTITLAADATFFSASGLTRVVLSGTVANAGHDLTLVGIFETVLTGSIGGTGQLTNFGSIFSGTGTIDGPLQVSQGRLSPGVSGPGVLTTGDVTFNTGTSFQVDIAGTAAGSGYSQLQVTGTVDLSGSSLKLDLLNFTPAAGTTFVIVESSGELTGTFNGLPDGATFTVEGVKFVINYFSNGVGVRPTRNGLAVSSQVVLSLVTTTQLTGPAEAVFGEAITFTAVVAVPGHNSVIPSGNIVLEDNGQAIPNQLVQLDANGVATWTVTSLGVGVHRLTAFYHGRADALRESLSPSLSDVITLMVSATTTLAFASAASVPSVFGEAVSFTVTVTSAGGTPTGEVRFFAGATPLGAVPLVDSTATLQTGALPVGSHTITARYDRTGLFGASSTSRAQTVTAAGTSLSLDSPINPSALGQEVTLTAAVGVTAPGFGVPTGLVTFLDGTTPLGTAPLLGNTATFKTAALTAGSHSLTARYVGDGNFGPSTTTAVTQVVNGGDVVRQPSTTTLTSSAGPSFTGQRVVFTANVSGPGGAPSGVVTFKEGTTVLAEVALQGGVATFATNRLAAGTHQLTASYSGDGLFLGSDANLTQEVRPIGLFAVGPDNFPGSVPVVKVYDAAAPAGAGPKFTVPAYEAEFPGGVRVTLGDLTGDGVPDLVTAPGPGRRTEVKVFDGQTGNLLGQFAPFGEFQGGAYLAAGDVNGDGLADLILGAAEQGGPSVIVLDGRTVAGGQPVPLLNAFIFDPRFTGGVRVAAGDVDADGFADLICAAGPGGGANVSILSGQDLGRKALLASYFPFGLELATGLYVSAADVNGDGRADIITGAGAGAGPNVAVIDSKDFVTALAFFFPYETTFTGGVRVGAVDRNADGRADVVAGPGPGRAAQVAVTDGLSKQDIDRFFFDPTFVGGLFVAGSGR